MKINVRGGTRSTTQTSLCDTCVRATVAQGMSDKDRIVYCHSLEKPVAFNVETCTAYSAFGQQSLYEMKEMATLVQVRDNHVGFFTPEQRRRRGWDERILPPEYDND